MRILHGTALKSWQRVKDLDRRLLQRLGPVTRLRLRQKRHDAIQQFRRAYTEQSIRRHVG